VLEGVAPQPLAIALSGGVDSTVLAFVLQRWCGARPGFSLRAFHVDHKLRPTSTTEADSLKAWGEGINLPVEVLTWQHGAISSGVQQKAREARYVLLQKALTAHTIQFLFLGHHQEDLLETFLLRFNGASGLKGLTSFREQASHHGMTLLRPWLSLSKADLVDFATSHGLNYFQDPSNENEAFSRVKIRGKILPHLISPLAAQSIARLQSAEDALSWFEAQALARHGCFYAPGFASLSLDLLEEPMEIQVRVLERALQMVFPEEHPPRFETMKDLMKNGAALKGNTLAGCYLKTRQNKIYIYREPAKVEAAAGLMPEFYWDKRFFIDNVTEKAIYSKVEIRPLGPTAVASFRGRLPHLVLLGLPSFWTGEQLLWVPHLDPAPDKPLARVRFNHFYGTVDL